MSGAPVHQTEAGRFVDFASTKLKARKRPTLFGALQTKYLATQAFEAGAVGFLAIAVTHLMTSSGLHVSEGGVSTLVSDDRRVLSALHFWIAVGCAPAAYLYWTLRSRAVAVALLVFAVIDAIPWLTLPLYGHAGFLAFSGAAVFCAVLGVRGASRLKRGNFLPPDYLR